MSAKNYIEETIDRYVYQVVRRVPRKSQKDIEKELRGLIEDMLKERCGELPREKKDLNVVLAELGAPSELAAQYRDQPTRYLIGPELFPKYWFILKIVLPVVAAGMSIAYLIVAILNPEVQWYVQLGRWLGSTIFGLTGVFAGMTLLFAIFEWRGISMEDLGEGLDLSNLPPVPSKKGRISRGESIANIVFTVLVILLFAVAPQLMSVYTSSGFLPIFNLEQLHRLMPLFLLTFGLGLLRDSFGLVEGRYTLRFAIVTTACGVLSIGLCLFLFRQPIWNAGLIQQINAVFPLGEAYENIARIWGYFQQYFVAILIFAYAMEIGTAWFRALRYQKQEESL